MIRGVIFVILSCACVFSYGQSKKDKSKKGKPVEIFQINKKSVPAAEFIYLYKKNHPSKPEEYTKEKILEYLDLFINFKLKVEEARQRGMDTTAVFLAEFNSYRGELRKPYLPDSKIIDSLTHLVYDRLKQEIKAAHILIMTKPDALPADTLDAYNRVMEIKNRILKGEDFEALAVAHSEDQSARENRGNLGYFTALQMVHPFETAVYQTPVGQIAGPVKTQFGYHLIKVIDKKPSRGEVEVAHIMIRTGNEVSDTESKNTIFEIHDQLRAGAPWEEMCKQYSQDQSSKDNGGKLRPFGVGVMAAVPEFEQAAFSLQKPGDFSDPIKTVYGWHIVRLERKIPLPAYDELAPTLKTQLGRDERLHQSKQAWQSRLEKEFMLKENAAVKARLMTLADSSLNEGQWSPKVANAEKEIILTLRSQPYTVKDFLEYVDKNQRPAAHEPKVIAEELYHSYVESKLMLALEEKVAKENPEFRYLMNEYYEGILLFEIMEKEVWNKAAQDSTGQHQFFNRNRSKYQADERVRATFYYASNDNFREELKKSVAEGDSVKTAQYVKENQIKHESGLFEKSDKPMLSKIPWAKGIHLTENNGMYYLAWIRDILPPGPKTFDESKASVVADYQQELEQSWLNQLRKKYPVKVNEKGKQYILSNLQK